MLTPSLVPDGVDLIPDNIMKITRCGCKSDEPCSTRGCSCQKFGEDGASCSTFCACEGGINCKNPRNNIDLHHDKEADDEKTDNDDNEEY
jgi:hypothetical protein